MINYTGLGKGGDEAQAEAQDGGGVLNANFATPPDGSKPRMQMYLWVPGAENVLPNPQTNVPTRPEALIRDGDFDSGVVVHEYGHGVSNRLTVTSTSREASPGTPGGAKESPAREHRRSCNVLRRRGACPRRGGEAHRRHIHKQYARTCVSSV